MHTGLSCLLHLPPTAGALGGRAQANSGLNHGAGAGVAPFTFAKGTPPGVPNRAADEENWGSPEGDGGLIGAGHGEGDDEELLLGARAELMDSILEDEEEIIAVHRQQIEESMEIVRR